jgi:hypothetical protein
MPRYYTNVYRSGNRLYVREIEDGKRRKFQVDYRPTLYVPSNKPTKLHASDGTPVEPIMPGSMSDAYVFVKKYQGVQNFRVFGNTQYEYSYLNEQYPGHIEYDIADMVVVNIDIEVASKGGFSTPEDANQEVTAIT